MTSKNIIYASSNLLLCHILPPQAAMDTLWFVCTLPLHNVAVNNALHPSNSLRSIFWAIVFFLRFDNTDELSLYTLRSVKIVGLAMHLFFCSAMIGIWKKYSDRNICLLHLGLLTSLPYWSFQDISWRAHRVQCQTASDHFTLSSTRVLNSSQPRKHFETYRFSSDFWSRCWNICQNIKKNSLFAGIKIYEYFFATDCIYASEIS